MTATSELPTAFIDDWWLSDMWGYRMLVGKISHHPRQGDFRQSYQHTSRIVRMNVNDGWAETERTRYILGEQHPDAAKLAIIL